MPIKSFRKHARQYIQQNLSEALPHFIQLLHGAKYCCSVGTPWRIIQMWALALPEAVLQEDLQGRKWKITVLGYSTLETVEATARLPVSDP